MQSIDKETFTQRINGINSIDELNSLRVFYLGKNGFVTNQFSVLKGCNNFEKKKQLGCIINDLRCFITGEIDNKRNILLKRKKEEILNEEALDITLPVRPCSYGKKHPITEGINQAVQIFSKLGFEEVLGNEIDDEFHIFDALNTPSYHPARQMQDSFYLLNGLMLRPHTSSVQIHVMESRKPPFKIIAPGRVYRCDSDVTHTPMFHQIEGLYLDKNINMSHLKFCINYFIREFFGDIKSRFRPSFFPFTEPSAEVDIMCSDGSWVEVLGCGIVHRNVLQNMGIKAEEYQGFAFGIGIERLTMLKYKIQDLRLLFDNRIDWLNNCNFY